MSEPIHIRSPNSMVRTACGIHTPMAATYLDPDSHIPQHARELICDDCDARMALWELAETDLEEGVPEPNSGRTINEVRAWMGLGPIVELEVKDG